MMDLGPVKRILAEKLGWNKAQIDFLAEFVVALVRVMSRSVGGVFLLSNWRKWWFDMDGGRYAWKNGCGISDWQWEEIRRRG